LEVNFGGRFGGFPKWKYLDGLRDQQCSVDDYSLSVDDCCELFMSVVGVNYG
jgi:hypothetical protein